jgi:hypothetical protein
MYESAMISKEELLLSFGSEDALVCPGSKRNDFKETRIYRLGDVDWSQFDVVCLNSFKTTMNRLSPNLAEFRNGLIEFDYYRGSEPKVPVAPADQERMIAESGVPWSVKIYTGGKGGWHWLWCLDEPLRDAAEYRSVADIVLGMSLQHADVSNKNANKFRRVGGATHTTTGREQTVVEVRGPVKRRDLYDYCNKYVGLVSARRRAKRNREIKALAVKATQGNVSWQDLASEKTKAFLEGGSATDRHENTMSACINLYGNCGLDIETVRELVSPAVALSGIDDRGDLDGILRWVEQRIIRGET